MTTFQSTLFIVFSVIVYMMIVDKNVGEYLTLIFKTIKMSVERVYWIIRLHPKNPITNLIMKIKYNQIAKQLQVELDKNK